MANRFSTSSLTRTLAPSGVLVAWTLGVWGTRIRNIAEDTELAGFERVWRTGLAIGLVLTALVAGAALLAQFFGSGSSGRVDRPRWLQGAIGALGSITIITWVARGIGIATADHGAAFIAVHLVLAVVSIGLAVWAWRSLTVGRSASGDQPGVARVTTPSSTSKFTRSGT